VPARDDITALAGRDPKPDLQAEWGYGGYAYAYSTSVNDTGLRAYYWSSTEYNTGNAYSLYFDTSGNVYPQYYSYKYQGFRVRCVK
jgi:uncharacterized protein (TIGR02145 family)